ncbi:fibrous sheath CABYR-binding protein-like isoform X2 [Anolis sagrei]|uniref:fibrous sheath CABYR-binding protein-like isoform X2 n=1 Tax=Anolis sagrei TaxID=38937 RepID=UPI00351FD057
MGRGLSRQLQQGPPPTEDAPAQDPPRAPLRMASHTSWFRKVRTRHPHRRVGPENTEDVPVAPPRPPEPQGTCAEEPSLQPHIKPQESCAEEPSLQTHIKPQESCAEEPSLQTHIKPQGTCAEEPSLPSYIIEVRPASKFLGREELPWADSSLEVQRGSLTSSERAESFLSEKSPTPPQNKLPKELGSKEVGIPSELFLPEWVALDLNTESVNELTQKMDSDEATLADIASIEDEVWDPPPSSSSSLSQEEAVDMALHPRRWSSLDPEQVRPRVPPGQAWDHHPEGIAQCLLQEMKRRLLQRPSR